MVLFEGITLGRIGRKRGWDYETLVLCGSSALACLVPFQMRQRHGVPDAEAIGNELVTPAVIAHDIELQESSSVSLSTKIIELQR